MIKSNYGKNIPLKLTACVCPAASIVNSTWFLLASSIAYWVKKWDYHGL